MIELTRAVRQTQDGAQANFGMQALNFGFYFVLTLTTLLFTLAWTKNSVEIIMIETVRQYIEVFQKIVFIILVAKFG